MNRDQRQRANHERRLQHAREVRALKDVGLNGVQIAQKLSLGKSYVYELLADPDGTHNRDRRRSAYSGACIDCGSPTYSGTVPPPERCLSCYAEQCRTDLNLRRQRSEERRGRPTRWTDDDIFAAMRAAATDGRLTVDAYKSAYANAPRGSMPSSALITRRFGFWATACERAGLHAAPRGAYRGRLTQEGALLAVEECAHARGRLPSYVEYQAWARENGAPSGSHIRNRCGGFMEAVDAVSDRMSSTARSHLVPTTEAA